VSIGVSLAIECPVLRRGVTDVGVNDVGVKGVRDAKESVSCEVWDTNVRIGLSLFLQEQQW